VRHCRPILLSCQLRLSFHSFVFDVGVKLAAACQQFASPHLTNSSLSLSKIISTQTIKARLLHYFPPSPGSPLPADDEPIDNWCGFHVDHSLLTGLCSVCLALLSVILERDDPSASHVTGDVHPTHPWTTSEGNSLTLTFLRTLHPNSWW
jgi:hypothetical protein